MKEIPEMSLEDFNKWLARNSAELKLKAERSASNYLAAERAKQLDQREFNYLHKKAQVSDKK